MLLILCLKWMGGGFVLRQGEIKTSEVLETQFSAGFYPPNGRNQKILVQERCAEVPWAGLQGLQVALQRGEKQGLKQ